MVVVAAASDGRVALAHRVAESSDSPAGIDDVDVDSGTGLRRLVVAVERAAWRPEPPELLKSVPENGRNSRILGNGQPHR